MQTKQNEKNNKSWVCNIYNLGKRNYNGMMFMYVYQPQDKDLFRHLHKTTTTTIEKFFVYLRERDYKKKRIGFRQGRLFQNKEIFCLGQAVIKSTTHTYTNIYAEIRIYWYTG